MLANAYLLSGECEKAVEVSMVHGYPSMVNQNRVIQEIDFTD